MSSPTLSTTVRPRYQQQLGPVLPALLSFGLGTVDWQRVLRRTGMPFRSPADDPARTVVAVAVTAVGGLLATVSAGSAMVLISGAPADRVGHALRPARFGAIAPLPVVGAGVAAWAETASAWRCTRAGSADGSGSALRTGVALAAAAGVHALVSGTVDRLLDHALPPDEEPASDAPAVGLNVVGPDVGDTGTGPDGFVVYLDGVGRCEARTTPVGRAFAAAVAERLPRWSVVLSLMPQDVTQRPASQRPVTGGLWRAMHRSHPSWTLTRGVWEAVVALDPRYRDRLAQEHTRQLVAHLDAAGYRRGSGAPVVLVGLSGGAQTALRAASEAARSLGGAPVDVVTLGAFADGSADLEGVRRVHAVVSWGDPAELLAVLLFPSRWTALGVGQWRRAKRAGTVVVRRHDFATHIGATGYLSGSALAPDGRTRLAQAADVVAAAAHQLLAGRNRVTST